MVLSRLLLLRRYHLFQFVIWLAKKCRFSWCECDIQSQVVMQRCETLPIPCNPYSVSVKRINVCQRLHREHTFDLMTSVRWMCTQIEMKMVKGSCEICSNPWVHTPYVSSSKYCFLFFFKPIFGVNLKHVIGSATFLTRMIWRERRAFVRFVWTLMPQGMSTVNNSTYSFFNLFFFFLPMIRHSIICSIS